MNLLSQRLNVSLLPLFAALAASAIVGCGGGSGTTTYTLGGSVSGLPADASVTLQNNGGDALTVSANGSFAFPALLPAGRTYSVTLKSRTPGLRCTVASGSGSIGEAAVTNVAVSCVSATLSIVHHFADSPDGARPMAEMLRDDDGNLYGTTFSGGALGGGTVFKLTPSGTVSILFDGGNASEPNGPSNGLARDASGNLYVVGDTGGPLNFGVLSKVDPSGTVAMLHAFDMGDGNGTFPSGSLLLGRDGNLYGFASSSGATNDGTLFQVTPAGVLTVLHHFGDFVGDGETPRGEMVQDTAGNLYGATQNGGPTGSGTVFRADLTGVITILHSFGGAATTTGLQPQEGITRDAAGNLYGTTVAGGGAGNPGTVFKVSASGVATDLHAFDAFVGDGSQPLGGVVVDERGNVYGTTSIGGAHGDGIVYKISASGAYTVLHSFHAAAGDGGSPQATLTLAPDGTLYGTTSAGGANNKGTIFKID